jgi:hypothetical protein
VGLPNCVEKKTPNNLETHRNFTFCIGKKSFFCSAGFFFVIRSPNNEYGKWDKTRLAVGIMMFVASNSASAVIKGRTREVGNGFMNALLHKESSSVEGRHLKIGRKNHAYN